MAGINISHGLKNHDKELRIHGIKPTEKRFDPRTVSHVSYSSLNLARD
jgi:hypothetical protein